jgi:glycerol-3-phosphate dehydrogenase (NAD(P)+)
MGLAGMGDLVVTCTSRHSRNRNFGLALAAGQNLEQYEQQSHMVVEGALAAQSVTSLAQDKGVELPICELIRDVVWQDSPIDQMVQTLMTRSAKPEFY